MNAYGLAEYCALTSGACRRCDIHPEILLETYKPEGETLAREMAVTLIRNASLDREEVFDLIKQVIGQSHDPCPRCAEAATAAGVAAEPPRPLPLA
jgi:hypothetical protein